MEVSGSGGGSKPESIDNMGKEKKEEKESSSGLWGSESGSDEEYCGQSENDSEEPVNPIWKMIYEDDSDGLMAYLNTLIDGSGDYHYEGQLIQAFDSSSYLNKLGCLKALLDSGVDWFALYSIGEDRLLQPTCMADTKDAAQLVIDYAKKKNLVDKLLGNADNTPLHVAAFHDSWNVIKLLLDQGADPCKRDAQRKLPCDCAYPGTKASKLLVDAVLKSIK